MAFRGNFEHTLDDRGRVAIPAKYRSEFPGSIAVIAPSPEGCLQVFPEPAFVQMSDEVASQPATTINGRRSRRLFDAQSFDTELDRQGRILIPARFREQLGLNGTVIIAGNRECLEIWTPEGWAREIEASRAALPTGQEQVD
jgi:MraZ protein